MGADSCFSAVVWGIFLTEVPDHMTTFPPTNRPIRAKRMGEAVFDELARMIISGELQADSNLLHQWPALLALALEISRLCAYRHPLPEVAFRAPDTLTTEDVAVLAAHVKGVIRL